MQINGIGNRQHVPAVRQAVLRRVAREKLPSATILLPPWIRLIRSSGNTKSFRTALTYAREVAGLMALIYGTYENRHGRSTRSIASVSPSLWRALLQFRALVAIPAGIPSGPRYRVRMARVSAWLRNGGETPFCAVCWPAGSSSGAGRQCKSIGD